MFEGFIKKLKKFLGLGAKPDADDKDAETKKLKAQAKKEVEAQSKAAEDAKKVADAEKAKLAGKSSEPKNDESSIEEAEKVADKPKIGYIHMSGCYGDQ